MHKPKIYSQEVHKISKSLIDPAALEVIETLLNAGHKAYLVGGGVRDLLLGVQPKDFDISTSAKPEEVKSLFRSCILIGRRFRLAHVRFGKKIIEVSTFRSGDNSNTDLILRDNVWGSEEEDVLRRDFTINGLYYDLNTETIIDYVGGMQDIGKKILRTIGQPEARFMQDPVRMIRLIKFCARLEFNIERKTFESMSHTKQEITKSSPARLLEEILKMLESGSSSSFFHLIHDFDFLKYLLPSLSDYFQKAPHNEILSLLFLVDNKINTNQIDRAILLCCLAFPLFRERLFNRYKNHNYPLHLGEIHEEAKMLSEELFGDFLLVPKALMAKIASILTHQFRILPFDGKKSRKLRPPKDESFLLALYFFSLRSNLEPELAPYLERWVNEGAIPTPKFHDSNLSKERKNRRRRK